jgi:DNA-binding response OmpR family regulator
VLRRGGQTRTAADVLEFDGIGVDLAGRQVATESGIVGVSTLEFDLLAALASAPGRVFTRAQLLERVWGWDYFGADRVVDVHVGNLRKALGDDASNPRFIATVRGVGYKFVAEPR